MKFLCLGYFHPDAFDAQPESERDALMARCYEQCKPFRATGQVRAEEALEPTAKAKSIRPRGGKPLVTDGPFIETKEQLGSFFIVEADSIEEAVAIASLHPGAIFGEEFGFGIEVRPIQD